MCPLFFVARYSPIIYGDARSRLMPTAYVQFASRLFLSDTIRPQHGSPESGQKPSCSGSAPFTRTWSTCTGPSTQPKGGRTGVSTTNKTVHKHGACARYVSFFFPLGESSLHACLRAFRVRCGWRIQPFSSSLNPACIENMFIFSAPAPLPAVPFALSPGSTFGCFGCLRYRYIRRLYMIMSKADTTLLPLTKVHFIDIEYVKSGYALT